MRRSVEFRVTSSLRSERNEVWARISTMAGVNDELAPFVKMTSPRNVRVLPADVTPGEVLFHSWLLLFGFIPFDRHALALVSINDGVGFVEESTSWLQSRWRHERSLSGSRSGECVIEDRVVVQSRIGVFGPAAGFVAERLFQHRHRRLIRRFGSGHTE